MQNFSAEDKNINQTSGSCVVKCPSCETKIRICPTDEKPKVTVGDMVFCGICKSEFLIPERPDSSLSLVVTCPHCKEKNRVPANRGILTVSCNHCKKGFKYDSGTWPVSEKTQPQPNSETVFQPQPKPKATPQPQAQSQPKVTPQPKPAYRPTNQETKPQNPRTSAKPTSSGFFEGISNYFKERKENAEEEKAMLAECELAHYIGRTVQNTLQDFRPKISAYPSRGTFFKFSVHKTFCDLEIAYTDKNDSLQLELILRCEYQKINDIFGWSKFNEIQYSASRRWFEDFVYNEYVVKTGFLIRPQGSRNIGILRSRL